jgi:protein TonB
MKWLTRGGWGLAWGISLGLHVAFFLVNPLFWNRGPVVESQGGRSSDATRLILLAGYGGYSVQGTDLPAEEPAEATGEATAADLAEELVEDLAEDLAADLAADLAEDLAADPVVSPGTTAQQQEAHDLTVPVPESPWDPAPEPALEPVPAVVPESVPEPEPVPDPVPKPILDQNNEQEPTYVTGSSVSVLSSEDASILVATAHGLDTDAAERTEGMDNLLVRQEPLPLDPARLEGYQNQLSQHLQRHQSVLTRVRPPRRGEEWEARVTFVLDRKGQVMEILVERVSGTPAFERAVEEMIRRAQPFPPIPVTDDRESIRIHIPIRYRGA